ncbi:hypothetical protein AAG906_022118 [Vitis piasezkii]
MSRSGPRFSGMRKQVLGLYRVFLWAARPKSPEDRRRIESFLTDRKNFLYIEYLLRRGKLTGKRRFAFSLWISFSHNYPVHC